MKMHTANKILAALFLGALATTARADGGFWNWFFSLDHYKEVAPVTDASYRKECGACHMAYPPGLLPERSWRKLLDARALGDHFGEVAELDDQTREHLLDYTIVHAADRSSYKRSKKVVASLKETEAPLRINEVPYIRQKHHEIPVALIKQNDKVKSLSYCDSCHTTASQGRFDDDMVRIPGYGWWTK